MTVAYFLILLTIFATVTSLITQAIKSFLDSLKVKYASNIVVLIVALIVGIGGTAIFYIFMVLDFNTINIICMVLMGLANWIGSMVGYDKVKQAVTQLVTKGE